MTKIGNKLIRLAALLATLFWSCAALAADLSGPVILEISGMQGAKDQTKQFNLDMLEEMGRTDITTDTPWTDGDVVFTGVMMRTLLSLDASTKGTIRAIALNDYAVDIPVKDILEHDVIVAMQRDGEYLTVRNRGPLWVIYPWADTPELRTEVHYSRSIWQLRRLELHED